MDLKDLGKIYYFSTSIRIILLELHLHIINVKFGLVNVLYTLETSKKTLI